MAKRFTFVFIVLGLAFTPLKASFTAFRGLDAARGQDDGSDYKVMPAKGRGGPGQPAPENGNLSYHQGKVMRTNTTYAIYWLPAGSSVSPHYVDLINGFFQNVAADSGKTSNVYYSDTQYFDTSGAIAYSSSFAGFVIDTNPFPENGCVDGLSKTCLSNTQIKTELRRVVAAKNWEPGPDKLFFIFTPTDVGSCAGSLCAFNQFCAYHGWTGSGSKELLYIIQPYAMFMPAVCDSGQRPNNDDADATINIVSHEHNEAITNQRGNVWFDRQGFENGDKCVWNFGLPLGSTAYGLYNQVIGSGKYYLQQEWSNKSSGCVLTGY